MGSLVLALLAALASGALLLLALPPADFDWLAWVCLAPLFAAIAGKGFLKGSLLPLATVMFAAWLSEIGVFYGWDRLEGEPSWHYVSFLLFGLVMVVLGAVLGEMKRFGERSILFLGVLALTLESGLLLYLPAHLGLTQYRSGAMLAFSSITGIWGVSFLVWYANIRIALAVSGKAPLTVARPRFSTLLDAAVLLAAILAIFTKQPLPTDSAGPRNLSGAPGTLVVAALQTTSGDNEELESMQRSAGANPVLVVWPELSGIAIAAGGDTTQLRELAAKPGIAPFVTTFQDDASPRHHNVAAAFSASGESGHYFKRKLFGGETSMHVPGDRPGVARLGSIEVGLNVCFDSCFPAVMRDTALATLNGPSIIALPCMGPETPFGFVQAIHGSYTPFRSAELGIPIVRGESSAFAMITDSDGRIAALARPGYVGPIVGTVSASPRQTIYRRFGDWFLWLCWLGTGVTVTGAIFRKKSSAKAEREVNRQSRTDLDTTEPSVPSS